MLKSGADQDPMVTPEKDIKKEVKAKIKEVEEDIKEVEEDIKEVKAKIKEVEEDIKAAKAKYWEEDLSKNPLYTLYIDHENSLASLESRLTLYEARRERLEIQACKNHSPRLMSKDLPTLFSVYFIIFTCA
jgi:chromosome segregation ATPase